MANKTLLAAILADILFLGSGILILAFCLIVKNEKTGTPSTGQQALRNALFDMLPLVGGIVNAAFIIIAFVTTLPALLIQSSRDWLKISGYCVTFNALFTLCLGVYLWIMTLKTGKHFYGTYMDFEPEVQALIQTSVRV